MSENQGAETLRKAASLMRERAEAATPGPWRTSHARQTHVWADRDPAGFDAFHVAHCCDALGRDADAGDAEHIASWHPDVALAVADWLESAWMDWVREESSLGARSVRSMSGASNDADPRALAVARAYLRSE